MNTQEQNSMDAIGYLLVRASTALGAIPLTGATVTVRDEMGNQAGNTKGGIIKVVKTDRDGNSPRISLPAPPRSNSTSPGSSLPFATYSVDVEADGYYRQYFTSVPVYEGITSIQPAMLAPISQSGSPDRSPDDDTYFDESVNPALRPAPRQN